MNAAPTTQTTGHFGERLVHDTETMARNEPAKVMAAALGAGLVLNMLPTRHLMVGMTAFTVTLLRPALLTLGVVKAVEFFSPPSIQP